MNTKPSVENAFSVREILHGARELIADPAYFCQRVLARDKHGIEVDLDSDDACRWCAVGAIRKFCRDEETVTAAKQLLRDACLTLFGTLHATIINDGEDGHARILAAFALAIERAP